MKKGIVVLVVLLLVSCSGIPPAEKSGDTLVIGSFVVDFPDGFFNEEPRTFFSGLALTFKNVTQDNSFTIATTDNGYFWFLSNGTDSYELAKYRYNYESGSRRRFVLDTKIGYSFTALPQSVLYVGHLKLTYSRPQKPDPTAYGGSKRVVEWNFDTAWNRDYRTEELSAQLNRIPGGSSWLSRKVVTTQELEQRDQP